MAVGKSKFQLIELPLTDIHKDPFDRMIMATALNYEAKLMSVDSHFIKYPELQGFLLSA